MKIRVIVPFWDKALNNEVLRSVGDIIDTEDAGFKCDEVLAKERVKNGFCELVEEEKVIVINEEDIPKVEGVIFNKEITPKAIIKPVKKGKKASKKK